MEENKQNDYKEYREKLLDLIDRAIHFFEERIVDDKFLPSRIKDECFYELINRFDNFEELNSEVGCVSNFVDVFLIGAEYAKKIKRRLNV